MAKAVPADNAKISDSRPRGFVDALRRFGIVLLGVIGCLALGAYVVAYWAERQVFTTDNWVQLVSPLPRNPLVSSALANYITDRVFSGPSVEDRIAGVLPPQAAFLASPLASQVQTLTNRAAQRLIVGDAFQTVWEGANRVAMNRLLAEARGQTPPLQSKINEKFDINLSASAGQLQQALGTASAAIPALQPATQRAIDISTDLRTRPKRLQQVVKGTDFLAAVLPLLILASVLWALAWARNRRLTTLRLAAVVVVLMLLELIAIKLLRQRVLTQVQNPVNLPAVGYVFDTLVDWLQRLIYIVAALAAVLAGILVAAGPARWAQAVRRTIGLDRFMRSGFVKGWRSVRAWLGRREYYVWLAVVGLALIVTAFSGTITTRTLTNVALLVLSLLALVHILATPPRRAAASSAA